MRYLAGFGVHAQQGVQGGTGGGTGVSPVFLHGDLTRSTMMTTDTSATVLSRVAYTAFGDPVTPDGQGGWRVGFPPALGGVGEPLGTRYQYEGGWGYESAAWGPGPGGQGAVGGPLALWGENTDLPPVTLQHVGWRWYQPSIGRFVQRDPIGLDGEVNVYAYCDEEPLAWVDPLGEYKVIRQRIVERSQKRILVHVYHQPTWEIWWDGPKYIRTITLPLNSPPPGTTCQNADDAAEASEAHENKCVDMIIKGAEEGEDAAKDNVRRWGTKPLRRR